MQRGDDLEISAELVDARDNSHIWGQQYSRKASDIFALQGDLAKEMTSMLRMRLTGEDEKRMTKSYTANPEAYQDYLKGRFWWNKRSEEGFNKGIEYFQQAIAKDPTYALAYSGLADCYSGLADFGFVAPKEAYPESQGGRAEGTGNRRHARRSSRLASVHQNRSMTGTGQAPRREFQRAIELNPSYATAHEMYGVALWRMGRLEEAIAEEKRAVELDPLSLIE